MKSLGQLIGDKTRENNNA
uniref:Uncharacterized protein n=1 Tax=Arundo donax TaxID=35708 RepID=A0A0A9HME7_ARUDO